MRHLLRAFTIVVIAVSFVSAAAAEDCADVIDEAKKSACFDRARSCVSIPSRRDRLECFDAIFDVREEPVVKVASPPETPVSPDEIIERESVASVDRTSEAAALPEDYSEKKSVASVDRTLEAATAPEEYSEKKSVAPVDRIPEIHASPEEFAERKSVAPVDRVNAQIVDVTTNAFKIDFLHLDNGHIWRETEDSRVRFKAGQSVTIEQGILGSFNLSVEGSEKTVKVKRIR